MPNLTRMLTAHPNSVGENYFEHMRFALGFTALLMAAGLCALVHAILPFCFERTAGNIIRRLHNRIESRG